MLAKLSVPEREVLTLVSQAQLSYLEVAEALNIPIGTVRSRLHSARKRIRTALSDFPGRDGDPGPVDLAGRSGIGVAIVDEAGRLP
ncbi:RNA polymerase sigma factor [Actinoplanes sp. CA-015351]|uniref:RNA polymerase sigma factor n=1 Tax=Actinoplanes sp. CA-015351 TaxID=3239897 RepID=UPI003D9857C5